MSKKDIVVAIIGSHVDTVTNTSNYLKSIGIKTVWAYLGTEAVSLCQNNQPDILLIDSTLSGMGGFEVAKLLPKQKIIIMTSLNDVDMLAKQFKNVVGIIKKPIDLVALEDLIRKKA